MLAIHIPWTESYVLQIKRKKTNTIGTWAKHMKRHFTENGTQTLGVSREAQRPHSKKSLQ